MTDERDDVINTLAQGDVHDEPAAEESESGSSDFMEAMERLEADMSGPAFTDLRQLIDAEKAEEEGRFFPWPGIQGAEIHIAHLSACGDKRMQLESTYRKRKGKKPSEPLDQKVDEQIWREAMFKTVVKGWRGLKLDGKEVPFTLQNYREFMDKVRGLRSFVIRKASEAQNFRNEEYDELSGN